MSPAVVILRILREGDFTVFAGIGTDGIGCGSIVPMADFDPEDSRAFTFGATDD